MKTWNVADKTFDIFDIAFFSEKKFIIRKYFPLQGTYVCGIFVSIRV